MANRKPIWDLLSEEEKRQALDKLIAFFAEEWDQTIGVIAAEQVLDAAIEGVFTAIYNKGLKDAQKLLEERNADIQVEIDSMLR